MKGTLIIAEAGVNHNGDLGLAKQLIDAAVDAGADIVKFQTFKAEKLATQSAKKAEYQIANTNNGTQTQFEMLKSLELKEDYHFILQQYCGERGIKFLSTPFDIDSIKFLKSLGIQLGKIPSGEITNFPYLKAMAKAFPEVILSTGMSTFAEVEAAVKVLLNNGLTAEGLTVLHCNTDYPTSMEDVNLKAMQYLRDKLNIAVGYSDHTLGIEVPIAAVALGATVIEKHFTLDRMMEGPDHKASLEPHELKAMVSSIRNIEKAISGSGIKEPSLSEQKNIAIARKSLVAARNISKGEAFTEDNIVVKRPGNGLSPMLWDSVIGQTAKRDFTMDELIEL